MTEGERESANSKTKFKSKKFNLHSHTVNDPLGAEALNTILRFLRAAFI